MNTIFAIGTIFMINMTTKTIAKKNRTAVAARRANGPNHADAANRVNVRRQNAANHASAHLSVRQNARRNVRAAPAAKSAAFAVTGLPPVR